MAVSATSRIPPERRVRHDPVVYFIKPAKLRYVKIGITKGLAQRLYELQHGCPEKLDVLLTLPGWVEMEARLHYAFIRHHSHGEWFRLARPIEQFIEMAKDPEFVAADWLALQPTTLIPPPSDLKRYIGGKIQLGAGHGRFGAKSSRGRGRLSEVQVRQIVENRWGMTNAELARYFDVSRVMVGKIRNGQAWKQLQFPAQV